MGWLVTQLVCPLFHSTRCYPPSLWYRWWWSFFSRFTQDWIRGDVRYCCHQFLPKDLVCANYYLAACYPLIPVKPSVIILKRRSLKSMEHKYRRPPLTLTLHTNPALLSNKRSERTSLEIGFQPTPWIDQAMHLLNKSTLRLENANPNCYAILSHVWEREEITY